LVYKDLDRGGRSQKPKYMYTKHLQAQKKYENPQNGLDILSFLAIVGDMLIEYLLILATAILCCISTVILAIALYDEKS